MPSPFYGTYRDQEIGGHSTENSLKYVALKDLFLSAGLHPEEAEFQLDQNTELERSFEIKEPTDEPDYSTHLRKFLDR